MGCHPNIGLSLERCLTHCAGKRSQQDRGGLKSTRVCGSHCCSHLGILENHICILESQKYHGEQLLSPVPLASWPGLLSWGEAGQALVGMCDPYREAQRSVCSELSLLWKSLRGVTGLDLGGGRSNGHHLAQADHLSHALCPVLVSSVETRWEKHLMECDLMQCATAPYLFAMVCDCDVDKIYNKTCVGSLFCLCLFVFTLFFLIGVISSLENVV